MKRPVPASNFISKDAPTQDDLRRVRQTQLETLDWIDAVGEDLSDHIADVGNPHSVTKTQVGLGNVTDDAQLKRADNDWSGFTTQTAGPVAGDKFLVERSSDSAKRVVLASSLRRGALWMPPNTPHANDVEFDSGSAPSGWAWWKSGAPFTSQTVGSTIDLYRAGYTSGNPEVSYTWRGSHLAFTVPYDNNLYYFLKDLTSIPTDAFFWTRLGGNRRSTNPSSTVAGDSRYSLVLAEQTSSAPALTNFVFLEFVGNGGAVPNNYNYRWGGVSAGVNVGGAGTVALTTSFDLLAQGTVYNYLGIQKLGTTYHGMLSDDEGHVAYLGGFTVSGTLRYLGIRAQEVTIPPSPTWTSVKVCDFIRQIDTGDGYFGLGQ